MNESDLELYGIVGKMFREIRENRGYTLEYVSDYLDIAPKSLQRYECGERKIKIKTIKALCEFYNIDCSAFMKEAKMHFISDCKLPENNNQEIKTMSYSEDDLRLQKIINCYNDMSEDGKNFLVIQAEICYKQFSRL